MKNKIHLTLAFIAVALAGCKHTHPAYTPIPAPQSGAPAETFTFTNQFDPAWLKPATNLFTLGPGDRVEIQVLGDTNIPTSTIVAPDGKIYFSFLPGIDVWGQTLSQARTNLEDAFTNYLRDVPRVSLALRGVESQRIWILGRVQSPGVYFMSAPMTLLEAIAMAGGTMTLTQFRDQAAAGISEELADLQHSFVVRHGKLLPVNFERLINDGDLSQNIYLEPDDFIYFPAAMAREVYVLGAVGQPQRVAYSPDLTVARAIASAYGTLPDAYTPHVAVVRGSLTQPQITIVNYRKVIRGQAPDMQLQPHDIVYVPLSPYRYIKHYLDTILETFVSSTAINAGEQAVIKQPTGGAGIFIPVGSGIQIIPPVAPPPP